MNMVRPSGLGDALKSSIQSSDVVYRPLGALRFLLSMMVVTHHFQKFLSEHAVHILHVAGLGIVAVEGFFVISGFIVAEAMSVFYQRRPGAFFVNRLLRIVPPYLFALALTVAVVEWLSYAGKLRLWYVGLDVLPLDPRLIATGVLDLLPGFHTSILAPTNFEFIPYVWTLRVEMAFYVAALMCLVFSTKNSIGSFVCGVLPLGLLVCGLFLLTKHHGLLNSGAMFLLGVSAYLLLQRRDLARTVFALACLMVAIASFGSNVAGEAPVPWVQYVLFFLLLCILYRLISTRICGWPKRVDKFLGQLSYPLYLNHYAVGLFLYDESNARGPVVFVVAALGSLAVAWLMSQVVERPLMQFRGMVRGTPL